MLGEDATRIDNSECLDLLESPPHGLLPLLDHQCKMPNSSESSFCTAANHKHRDSAFLIVPRRTRTCPVDQGGGFIVRHYAGDILYTGGHFIESNDDTLRSSIWLLQASVPLTRHLFTSPKLQPAAQHTRAGASFSSVGGKFSDDLSRLLETLSQTETHFIRCMKPNDKQAAAQFDLRYVRSRVRAAGSLAALRFMKKLYSGSGTLQLKTLARLREPKVLSKLPSALHVQSQTDAEFTAALLELVGVPAHHFRIASEDGVVHMCTALLPFLSAMEESPGEATDQAAAAQIQQVRTTAIRSSGYAPLHCGPLRR